jgi:DNA (cytosine-5)-methyltransferase 1
MPSPSPGNLNPSVLFRTVDLFAGAGGLSEGFRAADRRFVPARAVEWDAAAAATFSLNHGHVVYHGGIDDWLRDEVVSTADVVLGGPPCQGFSALGRRAADDERNSLWGRYAETILRAQPKFFVMENVPQFLTSSEVVAFEAQCTEGMLRDYAFEARVLNAADFGAPQVRRRAIVLGHHRDLPQPRWPVPSHRRGSWRTVAEAWRGLPEEVRHSGLPPELTWFSGMELPGPFKGTALHLTRRYSDLSLQRFGHIRPGGNRHDLPYELSMPCWRKNAGTASDVMGRLTWDRPSVTIRTEFFKPEKGRYLHPTQHRAITHQEAARLQGFRDDYLWVGSKTAIAKQIGNAVPVQLAAALGRVISESLDAVTPIDSMSGAR